MTLFILYKSWRCDKGVFLLNMVAGGMTDLMGNCVGVQSQVIVQNKVVAVQSEVDVQILMGVKNPGGCAVRI